MDVKTVCLAVLSRGPASGYEIRKQFETGPFRHFYDAGFGSIYPALGQLCREDLATVTLHAQEKRPDKKVYTITPLGRGRLSAAFSALPREDRLRSELCVMLFFAELVPPENAARIIDGRIAACEEMVRQLGTCAAADEPAPPGQRFVRGFGIALFEASARYLREHRDGLLNELRDSRAAVTRAAS